MCGINGILRLRNDAAPVDGDELRRVRDTMVHRGPDGEGLWLAADGGLGLGHRRLAIIDLSEAGLQPMEFHGGRYRIVFNGEIYNYAELRRELVDQGVRFASTSDTEVLLALFAREGQRMLSRLRGMYALAVWDAVERRLLLARDPYGIKPLYYTCGPDYLRFASQARALEAGGGISGEVDPAGLCGFLVWGSVPEPFTLRRGVAALPAGHLLEVRDGRVGTPRPHHDFSLPQPEPDVDVVAALERSVADHLVADVPVGVFLSAGLDSTLIAALARRHSDVELSTFTMAFDVFEGTPADEAPLAAEVARRLGTRHVERRVGRQRFLDLWPRALEAMDQPSIDGFNTYVVSQVAHDSGFKVVLSGLGGDELFGGYESFADVPRWRRTSRALAAIPGLAAVWPAAVRLVRPQQPKLRGMLRYGGGWGGAYLLRRGLFLPDELPGLIGEATAREGLEACDPLAYAAGCLRSTMADDQGWEAMHVMESTRYMRNQLLRDSDWASMAHSLELRVPLVDAWLRDSVARAAFEPARSAGKAAIVRRAAPELPPSIFERRKTGFTIPVMAWLDERAGAEATPGAASRMLALRVLDAFGVDLAAGRG